MILLYVVLSFIVVVIGFISAVLFSISYSKFTEGQFKRIVEKFMAGTLLVYCGMVSQFLAEIFDLVHTPFEFFKYGYLLAGFLFYLWASKEIHTLSKEIGFSELPPKLKKIVKS